ncbi:helix-turn-helix domain-containing protein [Streptomyces sp. NPDC003362]
MLSRQGVTMSIGVQDLLQLGGEHPELLLAIADMGYSRLRTMEGVYGLSRRMAEAKVASLLLYLCDSNTSPAAPREVVEGPSQSDIADALGLSRAAVENALAELRMQGALKRQEPGARRTNRRYEIADRAKLEFARIA